MSKPSGLPNNGNIEFDGRSEPTSECDVLLRKIAMDIRSEVLISQILFMSFLRT